MNKFIMKYIEIIAVIVISLMLALVYYTASIHKERSELAPEIEYQLPGDVIPDGE